jgi:hypothetical protein
MKARKSKQASAGRVRLTISLPADVAAFGDSQVQDPVFSNNWSAYVRSLIANDWKTKEKAPAS